MNGDITELLEKYGTGLAETRKLVPQLTEAITKQRVLKPPAFPQVPQFFTAEEAREWGIELEPDWMLKVTPPVEGVEPSISFITPEKWEITQAQEYISPEGQRFTREEIEAQLAAPEIPLEVEQVFGKVFPSREIEEVLAYAQAQPEAFYGDIFKIGRTTETEELLRTMYPEITALQLEEFFTLMVAPPTKAPEIVAMPTMKAYRAIALKVFPEYEANLDELLRWGFQNPEAFKQKIRDAGPGVFSEALLNALSPPPLAQPWYIFGQPGAAFTAGVGDLSATVGGVLDWLGAPEESSKVCKEFGEFLQTAYIPPADPKDFTWRSMVDPEWWATSFTRAMPFTLSLIPAAILAAHGGIYVAGAMKLGAFAKVVLGSLAAAGAARPIESALEAGGVYNEMIGRGEAEEEADRAANQTFWDNMKLAGWDAAQFITAFFPIKGGGPAIRQILNKRIVAAGIKVTAVGIMEAGEEAYQDVVQRRAMGEPLAFDPQMKEAMAIGFVFGAGLGGAGSVWETLINRVKKDMTPEMLAEFDRTIKAEEARGATPEQAELTALDRIAETPEGRRSIEGTIEGLKNRAKEAEPKEPADPPVLMTIPDSEKILDTVMADNWMRTLLQTVAKVPPARKLIEWGLGIRILVNRQSEAVEDIVGRGRFLHTEISRRAEGSEALIYWRLAEIERNPIKLFGFRKNAFSTKMFKRLLPEYAEQKEIAGTLEHIFTHPEMYSWKGLEKGLQYTTRVHKINTLILNMLREEGVAPENVGNDWWVHRVVQGKYDPNGELVRVRGRPGVKRGRIGAKVSFEMRRKAPTMADGIAWGILYGRDPSEYVASYAAEAFKKIADARFEKYVAEGLEPLAQMGVLPREELLRKYPEVVERAVITAEELAATNSFTEKINRAIRGEKLPEQTLRAIERRFPELGKKFRALVKEPIRAEGQLREIIAQNDKIIRRLKARVEKAEAIDIEAIKAEARAEAVRIGIPDEQKVTEAFRLMEYEDRLAFRSTMETQVEEVSRVIAEQETELGGIQEFLATDPVATYRGHIGKRAVSLMAVLEKGQFPESFTVKEAEMLMMGKKPKTVIKGRVPRAVVIDEMADHFGMEEQQLVDHIEFIYKQKTTAEDLKFLVKMADDRYQGIKRMLKILDDVDTSPEFIPKAEPGMPEAGIQQDIFGFETPVFPTGKGIVTQISMEDYGRLVELHKKEGLPPPNVVIKPKIEGVEGLEAETQIAQITYEVPPVKSAKEQKIALETLRKEVKALAEARRVPFWEAKAERAFRMEQVSQPGIEEGYIMHPFAGGRIFDQEFIDSFNKFFGQDAGLKFLRPTADTAGILRILKAALDWSQPAIQGTLSWGLAHSYLLSNPKVGVKLMGSWYKCFFEQIGAFFNPGIMARFMEANQEAISRRIAAGGSARAVFFFQEMQAVVGKGKIARMAETALRHIPLTPYQRAEVSFFAGGEIVRDRFWQIFEEDARAKGKEGELARFLDILTGIADPRAMGVPLTIRQMEQSWIWFSSAYTRSYLTLVAEILRGGMTGAKARRSLAGFIVAGAAYFTGIQYAISTLMGKDDDEAWEDVQRGFGLHQDPITGDWEWRPTAAFGSLKIGDNYFGIGGGIYGLTRLAGNIAATIAEVGERERIDLVRIIKHGSLNKRDNPFISWWYCRSSALFSPIYEMVTKQDFLGYPIETPEQYARYIISLLEPIWVEQSINPLIPGMAGDREVPEGALETAAWIAGEILGLRVNPEYAWQRFYNEANKYIPHIPEEELDAKQREAIAQGRKLDWGSLTKIQKINLLFSNPDLRAVYEEAQADSELRASPHWKAWEGRQEEERTTYYNRGNSLVERVITGELDTRELRDKWGEAGQNYGVALDMIEKESAYEEVYDFFDRQDAKGDKYLFEADMALAEYIEIMFTEYVDEKGDIDWDAKDRAIDAFIEKWGADYYEIIRDMYAQKRLLADMHPVLIRLSDDKDKLGRGYWRLPYKPIIEMEEDDEAEGNIPAEYYSLWKEYQTLETDAQREAFTQRHPEMAKDWRAEYRKANPEDDARLALWGYGGKLQSREAYELVVKWGRELGIPLEQMGLGLPPHSLIDQYFDYADIATKFSGNSAEARLFRLENTEWDAWGQENWNWKAIPDDISVEALKITAQYRDLDKEYEAIEGKEDRQAFLEAHGEYADARRRRDAYNYGFGEAFIKTSQRQWLEDIAKDFSPVIDIVQSKGLNEADQNLMRELSNVIRGILDGLYPTETDRLRLIKLSRKAVDRFLIYEGLTSSERNTIASALAEAHDFLEDLPLISRDQLLVSKIPEKVNLVETYVEYYKIPRAGYEDDWFLMEHPEFYQAALELLGWQERDFSKVPSREVYGLLENYFKIPKGKERLVYRHKHPELEEWLVKIKGYTPVGDRWMNGKEDGKEKGEPKTPWEEIEEAQKIKEFIEGF